MASFNITHRCGHTVSTRIMGYNSADKDRKAASLENQVCKECWIAEQNAANAKKIADLNFPALTGTEKQIDFANSIRLKAYNTLAERAGNEAGVAVVKAILSLITDAKFFCDNSQTPAMTLAASIKAIKPTEYSAIIAAAKTQK